MAREPRVRAAGARDVDRERDPESGNDGQGDAEQPGDGSATGETGGMTVMRLYRNGMCRSIKTLRRAGETATTGELEAAARQYVRKISGYRDAVGPQREAFEAAIDEIAAASRRLLETIGVEVEEGPDRWTPGSGAARSHPRVHA